MPFWSEAIAGVIGGVVGAFINPPLRHWWQKKIDRRDAARCFARRADRSRRLIVEFRNFFVPNQGGRFEFSGARLCRHADDLATDVQAFIHDRDKLLGLRETILERRIEGCYDAENDLAAWLNRQAAPSRAYPTDLAMDITLVAEQGKNLCEHANEVMEQLLRELENLA